MKILVVEDDRTAAEFIRKTLAVQGHEASVVHDGRDAVRLCLADPFDLVVLDRMMPGLDGIEVLRSLRAGGKRMPVLFLTALGAVEDRVAGLDAGADDYLAKPFHHLELVARVNALARRPREVADGRLLEVHDLVLDLYARKVERGGEPLDLKAKEFALLEYLMRNVGRTVTKAMLLEQVWNFSFDPQTTVVETHMSRLRGKVDKPFDHALIHTERHAGYCLRPPDWGVDEAR